MTPLNIILLSICLFCALFGASFGIASAFKSSKKEEEQEKIDELVDIYILQAIIKLHDRENLFLEMNSTEFKDVFEKFQNVKHRLTVDEINSLVKILYFIENEEEDS